jgi:hypothetical protein
MTHSTIKSFPALSIFVGHFGQFSKISMDYFNVDPVTLLLRPRWQDSDMLTIQRKANNPIL